MNKLAKFGLISSALAPVFVMYSIVFLMVERRILATAFFSLGLFLVIACIGILRAARAQLPFKRYRVATVEPVDNEVFALLLVYAMPLITKDIVAYNWTAWALVTVFFLVVTVASYGYHFNPLLTLVGFHFYKVNENAGIPHVLITKQRLRQTGERLVVVKLFDYVLLEIKRRS